MIESLIFEDNLWFEKKCLNVGLLIPHDNLRQKNKQHLIIWFFSKIYDICLEDLYNNIINNPPKSYPSSTRII